MTDDLNLRPVPTLETERFIMRPLQRGDETALFATLGDPEQCLYLTRPAFASEAELWGWLAEPNWNGRTWIAVDRVAKNGAVDRADADGAVAARLVAVPGHAPGVEEIGYVTCANRQRQGVARECAEALIAYLLATPEAEGGARKVTAEVDTRNTASVHLLESLGFVREAHFREHEISHIGMCDVYWYGLLSGDAGAA